MEVISSVFVCCSGETIHLVFEQQLGDIREKHKEWCSYLGSVEREQGCFSRRHLAPSFGCTSRRAHAHVPVRRGLTWAPVITREEMTAPGFGPQCLPPVTPSTVDVCVCLTVHSHLGGGVLSVENVSAKRFRAELSTNVGGADFQ